MSSTNGKPGGNRPLRSFKAGAVCAAIWPNSVTGKDGRSFEIKKVVLDRRYKTAQGEWKSANSLDFHDIPKAILALQKAYEYLLLKTGDDSEPVEEEAVY